MPSNSTIILVLSYLARQLSVFVRQSTRGGASGG
uniref:Uncharacterized protein n=1 Tax=Arundo donax TaxID=35708 RepID=A0A0A8YWM1_ARUDO